MKRILVSLLLLCSVALCQYAQETRRVYGELLGEGKELSTSKLTIHLDLGKSIAAWKSHDNKILDENGQEVVFNSMVDAMNYMGERGWNFAQAYVVTVYHSHVYHWVIYKDVTNDDQIVEGLSLRSHIRKGEGDCYFLTYLKKPSYKRDWEVVDEYRKCDISKEELQIIISDWKAQSDDKCAYDIRVKKE